MLEMSSLYVENNYLLLKGGESIRNYDRMVRKKNVVSGGGSVSSW